MNATTDKPDPSRAGTTWTTEDYTVLEKLARKGLSLEEISVALGRSPTATVAALEGIAQLRKRWSDAVKILKSEFSP